MQCDTSKCLTITKQQNISNIRQLPLQFILKLFDDQSYRSQTVTEGSIDNEDIAEQSDAEQYIAATNPSNK